MYYLFQPENENGPLDFKVRPSHFNETVIQILQTGETVNVKFQLNAVNYNQIKENPSADYVISFNSQFYYPGVIPVIQHVSMDTEDNQIFRILKSKLILLSAKTCA
ncbi:Hypothetical_protein [Hexamita inflata]|uniref:Hypothetical_protein n=1 Tax=Hexamita inflata TaxID=28002 RepID=A0ABP1HGH7_9EUKA